MGLQSVLYNTLFKRTSTFALTIALGAFVFEAAIDETSKAIFNSINRGKLWPHIKDNYHPKEE